MIAAPMIAGLLTFSPPDTVDVQTTTESLAVRAYADGEPTAAGRVLEATSSAALWGRF